MRVWRALEAHRRVRQVPTPDTATFWQPKSKRYSISRTIRRHLSYQSFHYSRNNLDFLYSDRATTGLEPLLKLLKGETALMVLDISHVFGV